MSKKNKEHDRVEDSTENEVVEVEPITVNSDLKEINDQL